jgi:hypothetical protein
VPGFVVGSSRDGRRCRAAGGAARAEGSSQLRGVRLIFEGLTSRPGVRRGSPSGTGAAGQSRLPIVDLASLQRRCGAFLLLVRAPATSRARWLGWCQSRVAAFQQNAASSRAQAIAMTPAGSRRSSCGCAERWCRRCLARRAWLGSDAGSAASGRHHPQRWTAGPGCREPLPACGRTIGTVRQRAAPLHMPSDRAEQAGRWMRCSRRTLLGSGGDD